MADLPISGLPPVTLPLPADEFGVNNDGISKKMTRLQVHTLQSGEVLVLPNGDDASNPELQFPNSGFYEDLNDELAISQGNVNVGNFTSPSAGGLFINNLLTGGGLERVLTTGDGASFGEYQAAFDASSGSFPVTANQADWFNTTVAGTIDSQAFAVGDILISLVDSPSTSTFAGNWTIVPHIAGSGDVTKVGIPVDNQIGVWTGDGTIEGTTSLTFDGSLLRLTGSLTLQGSSRPGLRDVANAAGVPTVLPDASDIDTGLSTQGATNALATIVGGAAAVVYRNTGAGDGSLEYTADLTSGLAASTTQVQGEATQNSAEYSEITSVANPNDVITLGAVAAGRKITIVNSGVNILQIFPTSGDDLGNGVDSSTALGVGESVTFFGLDSINWAVIAQPSSGGGSGDVTKVGTPVDNQVGVWTGDGTIEGTAGLTYTGSIFQITGNIQGSNTSAPQMQNIVGTATVPNLNPSRADPNTGFSAPGGDTLNIITGSQTAMILSESAGLVSITAGQSTSLIGLYGVTPAVQSAVYARNATIVEDRTLLASASATATNNNNVLAALIADLQSRGFIAV